MVKNTLFFLALSIAFNSGFCQGSGKLFLIKGQKYAVENKFSAIATQEMMGQPIESKIELSTSASIEVKGAKDNNYNLTNTYTKIKASLNAMGQDMNFDSDKKEDMNGEMGSSVKDLIGKPKDVVIDKDGRIIPDKNDTAGNGAEGGMMAMLMKQVMGNPEETGFGLSEMFIAIPAKASVGYTWQDSTSGDGMKKFTTYTIKEIKESDAIVTISGTTDVDTKTEMQGQEIANKTTGKINGEEIVDLKTGIVKQKNTTIQSSGKVTVMGQEIPSSANITTVSTIKNM